MPEHPGRVLTTQHAGVGRDSQYHVCSFRSSHHARTALATRSEFVFSAQMRCNSSCHVFRVGFNFPISESNDLPPLLSNVRFSLYVLFADCVVVTAVNFNDKRFGHAGEVNDERTDRMLASKFQAAQLAGP